MKITTEDSRIFYSVMVYFGLDEKEVDQCRKAYLNDPDAGRITYAAVEIKIPKPEIKIAKPVGVKPVPMVEL